MINRKQGFQVAGVLYIPSSIALEWPMKGMHIDAFCAFSCVMDQIDLEMSRLGSLPRDTCGGNGLANLIGAFWPLLRQALFATAVLAQQPGHAGFADTWASWSRSALLKWTQPKCARCSAVASSTGVSRSAHTSSRLSQTTRITCSPSDS